MPRRSKRRKWRNRKRPPDPKSYPSLSTVSSKFDKPKRPPAIARRSGSASTRTVVERLRAANQKNTGTGRAASLWLENRRLAEEARRRAAAGASTVAATEKEVAEALRTATDPKTRSILSRSLTALRSRSGPAVAKAFDLAFGSKKRIAMSVLTGLAASSYLFGREENPETGEKEWPGLQKYAQGIGTGIHRAGEAVGDVAEYAWYGAEGAPPSEPEGAQPLTSSEQLALQRAGEMSESQIAMMLGGAQAAPGLMGTQLRALETMQTFREMANQRRTAAKALPLMMQLQAMQERELSKSEIPIGMAVLVEQLQEAFAAGGGFDMGGDRGRLMEQAAMQTGPMFGPAYAYGGT